MKRQTQILLVEDDANLGFLLKDSLDAHGWKVSLFPDGEKGLTAFHSHSFDLCVLDVMLPEKDGFDLAREIRKYNQLVPIVFLTAKNQTADRIKGFQAGADDYVCKPFSVEEFKYRIEAILKRSSGFQTSADRVAELRAGKSILNINNLSLDADGSIFQLTYKEAKVLQLLFRHVGKLVERDIFLKSIWENDGFFVARSMDVFVSRIRKYIKDDQTLRIDNVRGIGYILKETK